MHFLSGILTVLDQKEKRRLFLLIFLDVIISALDVAFLGALVWVINFYVKGSGLPHLSWLPPHLADQNSVLLILIFFVLFGIKNIFAYNSTAFSYRFAYGVASRLSERGIRSYLKDDYLKFINIDSAVLIRRISHQPLEFSLYILINFQQMISQGILMLFIIITILFYHAALFLLLLALLLPAVAFLGWLLKRRLRQVRLNIKKTNHETLKNLKEVLSGYIESNIYGKNDFFAGRYYSPQRDLNQLIRTQQSLQALPSRLIEVFAVFGFFILVAISKWSSQGPVVDLLTMGIFMAAAYKIIPGMVKILNNAGQMKTYEFTLQELLTANNDKSERKATPSDAVSSVGFQSVGFGYGSEPVLKNLSFQINSGDFVGISGDSGRGKTTVINLLLGFIAPDSGTITINEQPTDSSQRQHYWDKISYIKQQPFFIHDSMLKNITLQESGWNMARLSEVIAFCGLNGLISQCPGGLDWVITENGKNLSGGQRQRIMLARALYHGFDLLILDEPFGEMDQQSENDILQRLQLLAKDGKMIIFITHNKPSLSYCNKVISFNE